MTQQSQISPGPSVEVKGEAQRIEYWKNYPPPERLYPRLMTLAEKYPKDAAAVDALIWVAMHQPLYSDSGPKDQETRRKALETRSRSLLPPDRRGCTEAGPVSSAPIWGRSAA